MGKNRVNRGRGRRQLVIAGGVVLLAVVLAPALAASLWAPSPAMRGATVRNPAYATQDPDPYARREAQIRWAEEEGADASLETCSGIGIERLAEMYDVPQVPDMVAREYAKRNFEPAFRSAPHEGCLQALRGEGG